MGKNRVGVWTRSLWEKAVEDLQRCVGAQLLTPALDTDVCGELGAPEKALSWMYSRIVKRRAQVKRIPKHSGWYNTSHQLGGHEKSCGPFTAAFSM